MSTLTLTRTKVAGISALFGSALASIANAATIVLPTEVQETIESTQTVLLQAGGYLIVLAVVAMAIRWVRALFV